MALNANKVDYIRIDSNTSNDISTSFYGVNTLYWLQDDETRVNKNLNEHLKNLQLGIMRYPGGEISDNFHWRTNTLNDPDSFPYSKSPLDSKIRMDFDEFIAWSKSLGTTASIVVNLENGYVDNDIEKAANLAADWVRYANITKGYKIKYWEIGNETDILETRYPVTSSQYANALKIFSKKMKAVDPSIKIGAVGPVNYNVIANIELLSQHEINKIHEIKKQSNLSSVRKFIKSLAVKKRKKRLSQKERQNKIWWSVVAEEAGEYFDFAIVHRYYSNRKQNSQLTTPLNFDRPIKKLRDHLIEITQKEIPIAITEWSFPKNSHLSGIYKSLTMAEMIGDYLKSGALFTEYFPMYKHKKNYRSLFKYKSLDPKPIYHVYKAFSSTAANTIFKTQCNNTMLYTIATYDSEESILNLYIINKSSKKREIDIDLPFNASAIDKSIINNKHSMMTLQKRYLEFLPKRKINIEVSPLSLTLVRFLKHKKYTNEVSDRERKSIHPDQFRFTK